MSKKDNIVRHKRTLPLKRPDGIISSDFSNGVPFQPSYSKKCGNTNNMFYLMAHEYAAIWKRELEEFDKALKKLTPKKWKDHIGPIIVKQRKPIEVKKVYPKNTKYEHIQSRYKQNVRCVD